MPHLGILAFAMPAALLIGISKGGFGGALGGLAVPLLALVMPPTHAAAVVLPVLCMADFTGLQRYYRKWDVANLKIMLPGAIVGILVGSLTFGMLSEHLIGMIIGVIAIVFFLLGLITGQNNTGSEEPKRLKGALLSGASGFTSFVAHAGGPPVMMYLLPQQMEKVRFIATCNVFFLLINAMKLIPYTLLGQFTQESLLTSMALGPVVVLGVWLGGWLQGKVNQTWFYRIARLGLLLTGTQLMIQNW
ncbi:sulfite exporter TauE/SafE family protein [Pseudomonas sp. 2FG]|uniref:sulfite exporter TauE/SafE family protein n=1 Tax=Pseudomonas sp. 2FG TaxID=2502191 RepID=UPI0010F50A4D|nr:sulfite exporter TauE/SafE family protein [Pseudomonas sp. 2FG]